MGSPFRGDSLPIDGNNFSRNFSSNLVYSGKYKRMTNDKSVGFSIVQLHHDAARWMVFYAKRPSRCTWCMLCYVMSVQRCRKSREKMAMARLGQWLVWASFQLSMFTEQVFARAEHRALQTVIMQKGNWCCAQWCVVLCANRKVVCLVLFCEKQLSAEYAKLYTECAKCDAQIALCACTKKVCTVCRAEFACMQKGNAQLVQNPLFLPSAVLALAADFQSETTARQYDWQYDGPTYSEEK